MWFVFASCCLGTVRRPMYLAQLQSSSGNACFESCQLGAHIPPHCLNRDTLVSACCMQLAVRGLPNDRPLNSLLVLAVDVAARCGITLWHLFFFSYSPLELGLKQVV